MISACVLLLYVISAMINKTVWHARESNPASRMCKTTIIAPPASKWGLVCYWLSLLCPKHIVVCLLTVYIWPHYRNLASSVANSMLWIFLDIQHTYIAVVGFLSWVYLIFFNWVLLYETIKDIQATSHTLLSYTLTYGCIDRSLSVCVSLWEWMNE